MAHGDYDCCAICDRKLSYNPNGATTKEELCNDCVRLMHSLTGQLIMNQVDLLAWLSTATKAQVEALGFSYCFYDNPVDTAVMATLDNIEPT